MEISSIKTLGLILALTLATFSGASPIEPANDDSTLTRVNDRTFEYIFVWDETQVKIVDFNDGVNQDEAGFSLGSNYPNPFNPITTVRFSLPGPALVQLTVHDLRGRLVAILVDASKPAGAHTATWTGLDLQGQTAAAGVYLMKLQANEEIRTGRMVLLK